MWTVMFAIFFICDFFSKGNYDFLMAPFSMIYVSILGLYVGTKEFDRWYDFHESRHPGEWFVIGWTILMAVLTVLSFFMGKGYEISAEGVADYIMVLSVFILTHKSKQMHHRKHGHR